MSSESLKWFEQEGLLMYTHFVGLNKIYIYLIFIRLNIYSHTICGFNKEHTTKLVWSPVKKFYSGPTYQK